MARFNNLYSDYYDATKRLAQTWQVEKNGWQDKKAQQFSEQIMTPVSNECGKIHELLLRMDYVLSQLVNANLIDEK